MKPLPVQVSDETRALLAKQAEALGIQTENQWAGQILHVLARVPADKAFLVLGKVRLLAKSPRPRISDL